MTRLRNRWIPVALLLVPVGLAGCHIDTHRNGNNDDVNIGTPFGSLQVKTDQAAVAGQVGLTPYPGAVLVHKKDGDDGAADVNLSFGKYKLSVHAMELQTADPQSRVLTFYRKDMGRYGAVLTCNGRQAVGQPTRTAEGLTCDADRNGGGDDDEVQLRAGSPGRQHIVGLHTEDGGTRIGLVALDLPLGLHQHSSGDRE